MRDLIRLARNPSASIAIASMVFVTLALLCYDCTLDDAFISFRYAQNLADGRGLVFNPGERVEGFSNPLWVLILSLFALGGIDIVVASKVIGLACGILVLALTGRLYQRVIGTSRSVGFLTLLYLASTIGFVYYAVSGMETIFYTCWLVLMHFWLIRKREVPAGLACGILAVTRPEGILFVIPLIGGCYLSGLSLKRTLVVVALPVACFAALVLFRLSYYGALLPNSFHVKIDTTLPWRSVVVSNTKFLVEYTWFRSVIGGAMVFLAALGTALLTNRKNAPMTMSILVTVFFVWFSRYDWMAFWRFYVPVLPLLVMFGFASLDLIHKNVTGVARRSVVLLIFSVLLATNAARTMSSIRGLQTGERFNPAMNSRPHVDVGRYLARIASPSDVVVVNEIGAIAYYSELHVMDMFGLTDPRVPQLLYQASPEAYAGYFLNEKPRFIMLNDKQKPEDTGMRGPYKAIFDELQESGMYRTDRVFPLNDYKNLILFVRDDSRDVSDPPGGR